MENAARIRGGDVGQCSRDAVGRDGKGAGPRRGNCRRPALAGETAGGAAFRAGTHRARRGDPARQRGRGTGAGIVPACHRDSFHRRCRCGGRRFAVPARRCRPAGGDRGNQGENLAGRGKRRTGAGFVSAKGHQPAGIGRGAGRGGGPAGATQGPGGGAVENPHHRALCRENRHPPGQRGSLRGARHRAGHASGFVAHQGGVFPARALRRRSPQRPGLRVPRGRKRQGSRGTGGCGGAGIRRCHPQRAPARDLRADGRLVSRWFCRGPADPGGGFARFSSAQPGHRADSAGPGGVRHRGRQGGDASGGNRHPQ